MYILAKEKILILNYREPFQHMEFTYMFILISYFYSTVLRFKIYKIGAFENLKFFVAKI